jgi:shikimate kinase
LTKILLIGYMGSGKSTVGKLLSQKVSLPFVDLDQMIEKTTGLSISQLFEKKGEIYFRNKEKEVLFDLLNSLDSMVIASGGGTPCYGDTMEKLQAFPNVSTVYLNVALDVLVDRLYKERKDRPLIAHIDDTELLKDFVRKHLFERAYYYNQADHVIDAANKNKSVEKIVASLF